MSRTGAATLPRMNLRQHLADLQDIAERASLYSARRDGNGPEVMSQLFRDLAKIADATVAVIEAQQSAP